MASKKPVKSVGKVAEVEVAVAVEKVSKLAAENVVKSLGNLQLEAQGALSDLAGKIVSKVNELRDVNLTITDANRRLQELYDIEAAAVDLEQVRAEIQAERDSWEIEKAESEQERLREEEQYNYTTGIKRRNEADKVAENHRIRETTLVNRENDLKAREAEFNEFKKQVDGIPTLLKKESEAAVAIATNSLKKTYEHEKILASKDSDNARKEHEFAVAAMKEQIGQLLKDKQDLKNDLAEARRSVEATAIAGLNAQSGRDAMNAVQRTLETNASGNNSGKR